MRLNSYKAEFGHTGGANIQVVSKSGSADYHGSGTDAAAALERLAVGEHRTGVAKPRSTSTRPDSISAAW